MNSYSRIVAGGGWKESQPEKLKVKAWMTLAGSLVLGSASVIMSGVGWLVVIITAVPACLGLVMAIVLFIREEPKEIWFPWIRSDYDIRKLYYTNGSHVKRPDLNQNAEQGDGAEPPLSL